MSESMNDNSTFPNSNIPLSQPNICPGCGYCRQCGQYRGVPAPQQVGPHWWPTIPTVITTGGTAAPTGDPLEIVSISMSCLPIQGRN